MPASRLLISASERVIQALVAYISRRDARIHPPSASDADFPMTAVHPWMRCVDFRRRRMRSRSVAEVRKRGASTGAPLLD